MTDALAAILKIQRDLFDLAEKHPELKTKPLYTAIQSVMALYDDTLITAIKSATEDPEAKKRLLELLGKTLEQKPARTEIRVV